ncbi:hypothetical protein D6853_14070 [Butyrivibrio sp. X503]|uniref:hypothetical protein n=1 Tax=Butyrivibrio sp. X503 TaxID=2364878 RepID=UPI000EA8A631|nr:hypothetical protein [Butyrivibrio sp. X503]RKM54063.1 hypothetical protein D6853_14070 [Butyrivibrio sp. X503]
MADNNNADSKFIVGGYEFLNEDDAKKASMDESKIKLLETKINASRPSDIKAVYEKAIENKIFKSPIGWQYLMDLRNKLLESGYSQEDLIPIPLNVTFTRHSAFENIAAQQRVKPPKNEGAADFGKIFSIILNIVLAILVIVMFVIASKSDSDNIINYKRNITNRYSAWDEELKEREKAVREAEKKLGIEAPQRYDGDIGDN